MRCFPHSRYAAFELELALKDLLSSSRCFGSSDINFPLIPTRSCGYSWIPLDTFALWSRGNIDPLVHRVVSLLKEIKKEL